ncbi:hypothetical protein AWL63_07035 [Sphingomonas panacis]|uniref:SGNH hydrolase-type esterase domain-containing protein n=1 Tax=Sphingomonas panacis TaxID=1560345 RepID=A0A1B3Z8J7_9SPHN|nr:hypothetical protein [Sphingomonas panacis]AOH83758.1 hypothetical protein AWL63_07035 [Sphingomonas panacis]
MSARHIVALAALLGASPAAAESDPAARGLALRANTAAAARVPRLSVISGAEQWYGLAATLTPGTFNTVRVLHRNLAGCTATGLRLLAGNYGWANTSSAGSPSAPKERQNPYPIIIHSAFEFAGTKTDQQQPRSAVRWGGQPTATLTPSTAAYAFPNLLLSDPVPASVAPGAAFYERSSITQTAAGQQYFSTVSLRGGTTGFGTDSGEGSTVNSGVERAFDNAAGDVSVGAPQFAAGWSALAVLGICADGSVAPSIAIAGDSIVAKVDDAGYGYFTGGWALRAFAAYPHMLLALPGEREMDAVQAWNSASRFEASGYATHVLWAYGRNDLSYDVGVLGLTPAQALAAMKAVRLQAAKAFMMPRGGGAPGQVFIAATILPAPTSSDGFLTMAGQSKDAYEAGRVLFNQWLRDPGPAGFIAQANAQVAGVANAGVARVADPCAGLEVNAGGVPTRDGGYSPPATVTYATGTSSGSNTSNSFNDSSKAWAAGALRGAELQIVSGTGAGQYRGIGGNSATQVLIADPWTTLPDASSTYRITDAPGWNGVHPGTRGAILSAAGINAGVLMRPLAGQ